MPKREHLPWSEFRNLRAAKGPDKWWVDEGTKGNGIEPVCLFCGNLIDWNPWDHSDRCPVPRFFGFETEE